MTSEKRLVETLNNLILKVVPEAKTVSKYGGTLYTLNPDQKEGQFCGVFSYENHVQLSFSNGNQLNDIKNLLSGGGKQRRHINFTYEAVIDEEPIIDLIKQSADKSLK